MSKWVPIDIAGPHNPSRYPQVTNEQLHNMYLSEQNGSMCLFPYPGYKIINSTIGDTNPRALFYSDVYEALIGVFGKNIYIIRSPEKSPEIINANIPLSTSDGRVYIAESVDAKQVMFVAGGEVYLVDNKDGDTFQNVAIPQGVVPSNIIYKDASFIICDTKSSRWYVSAVNNGKVWNTDNRGRIDSRCVALGQAGKQVLVFGTDETTVFYDAGTIPFPWQEVRSTFINYGCIAAASVAQGFGLCAWLATNRQASATIMVSDGSLPKPISNDNIDALIDDLEFPDRCEGFLFQQDGHLFYQLNFYSDHVSIAYDFTSKNFIKVGNDGNASEIQYVGANRDRIYCLIRAKAGIHELSNKITSNDGKPIERIRVTKTQYFDDVINITQVRLRMQHGVDGAPFIERLDDKIVNEFGQLSDNGFFESLNDLTDAQRGDYWHIKSEITVNSVKLKPDNVIICNQDISGTPTDLSSFRIVTTDPLGKLRFSVSHDFGVTYSHIKDINLDEKTNYEDPFYVLANGLGSYRAWTFKFEVFSKDPVAIIEAKALVGN